MTGPGTVRDEPIDAETLLSSPRYRWRHELESGRLVAREPTGDLHAIVVINVGHALQTFAAQAQMPVRVLGGEPGFILARDPDTVRAPDLAVLLGERAVMAGTFGGFVPGPPDLAVEVRSPRDSRAAHLDRAGMWLAAGAKEAWLVDPDARGVHIVSRVRRSQILAEDGTLTGGPLLPGLEVQVRAFFL